MESFKTKERRAGGKAKGALSAFVSLTEWDVAAENTSEDIWVALLQIRLPVLSHFPSKYQRTLKSIGDYSRLGKGRQTRCRQETDVIYMSESEQGFYSNYITLRKRSGGTRRVY